jgi:carboxylesterase type B
VFGESAGAGSIVHHLTQFGGKQDPLFKKAMIQSPAFNDATWDRRASQRTFQALEIAAGCAGKGIECLRSKSMKEFSEASKQVMEGAPEATFAFGPSPDGGFVRQLPQLELVTGNFAKQVDTLVVSHVTKESNMFLSNGNKNNRAFKAFVDWSYGNNTKVTDSVLQHMPLEKYNSSQFDRMAAFVQWSTFMCSTRFLTEAYKGKTYNVEFAGNHGQDIGANFFEPGLLSTLKGTGATSSAYQKYLISVARSGNPNTFKEASAIEWPKATLGPEIGNVLAVDNGFKLVNDKYNTEADCGLFKNIYALITKEAGKSAAKPYRVRESVKLTIVTYIEIGFAPPGVSLQSSLSKST